MLNSANVSAAVWLSNGISTLDVIITKVLWKSLVFFKQMMYPIVIAKFHTGYAETTNTTEMIASSANHNNCRLLCHLFVILKVIFANSVEPDQTAPLGAV